MKEILFGSDYKEVKFSELQMDNSHESNFPRHPGFG